MNSLTGKRLYSQPFRPLLSTSRWGPPESAGLTAITIRPLLIFSSRKNNTAALRAWTHVSVVQGGGALYTQQSPAFGHVRGDFCFGEVVLKGQICAARTHEKGMSRIGRVIMFVVASVVSG